MPKIIIENRDTDTTLNRPILLQVTEDVRRLTGFPKDINVYYKSNAKQVINRESVMNSSDKEMVNFSHENRIEVSGEVQYSDLSVYEGQPFKKSYPPILYDKENLISLSPIFYTVEMNATLSFISKDKQTLEKWKIGLRRRLGQSVKGYQHRIDYIYPLNYRFIEILLHLYETKETYISSDETFLEWIRRISSEKITGVTNQLGKGLTPVVEQGQIGVVGIWNFSETPTITKMDSGDMYQSDLSYLIKYPLVSAVTLEYPVILNNAIISKDYRPPCDFNEGLKLGKPDKLLWGLMSVLDDTLVHYPSKPLMLPCFDEWRPTKVPYGTATIYQALVTIDTESPKYVMDLIDLGEEYELAPWLIETMKSFGSNVLLIAASPVLASLYRNNKWSDFETLKIDEDLKLYVTEPLELYNEYHVRLSLYTDLSLLTENALEQLRRQGKLTNELFKTLGPEFIDLIPDILSDGSLNNKEMWDFISLLKDTEKSYKNDKEIRRFTVGSCLIDTRRIDDAFSDRTQNHS